LSDFRLHVLNLQTKRWSTVAHGNGSGPKDPIADATAVDDSSLVIFYLDMSFVSRDGEIIPKFSVDIFEQERPDLRADNATRSGSWFWSENLQTKDLSGYSCRSRLSSTVQVDKMIFVFGFGHLDFIKKDGRLQNLEDNVMDTFLEPSFTIINRETMDWFSLDSGVDWAIKDRYTFRATIMNDNIDSHDRIVAITHNHRAR